MATTHDRIKALSRRVYVDAIPLGEFCEALAEFAEAEQAELRAALVDLTNAVLWITDQSDGGRLDAIADLHKHGEVIEAARAAIRNAHATTGATR